MIFIYIYFFIRERTTILFVAVNYVFYYKSICYTYCCIRKNYIGK